MLVWSLAITVAAHAEHKHFYLELTTSTFAETEQVIEQLETLGLTIRHILPPDRLIVTGPEELTSTIEKIPQVKALQYGRKGRGIEYRSSSSSAADIFSALLQPAAEIPENILSWADIEGRRTAPEHVVMGKSAETEGISTATYDMYTAEYMIGRIAVALILMESDASGGDAEDWTGGEQIVINEVLQGLDWLCDSAEAHNVKLSWSYEFHFAVPTGYEPIQEPSVPYYSTVWPPLSWEFLWIDDALDHLAIAEDEWDGCFALANRLRSEYHANWAYEVFVVNSEKDEDHYFADGLGAYMAPFYKVQLFPPELLRYGSPVVVIPYRGDYLDYKMDRTFAHETAHVFGASDEYSGPPWPTDCDDAGDCDQLYGYLSVRNGNCEYCNPSSNSCIMKSSWNYTNFCEYSLGQIGWRDLDGDGPADPIDPNHPYWATIYPVQPGDLVRIFTLGGDFVQSIAVTEDNRAESGGDGYIVWDLLNRFGTHIVPPPDPFLATINNGEAFTLPWRQANPSILPEITDVHFDDEQGEIHWRLANSFAYIRCFLHDSTGQVISRPIWDKLHSANEEYITPLSGVGADDYFEVRFTAWRTDGGLTQSTFTHDEICYCGGKGDVNNDGGTNPLDVSLLVQKVYKSRDDLYDYRGLYNCPYPNGDIDCSGGTPSPLDVTYLVKYVYKIQDALCDRCFEQPR